MNRRQLTPTQRKVLRDLDHEWWTAAQLGASQGTLNALVTKGIAERKEAKYRLTKRGADLKRIVIQTYSNYMAPHDPGRA
jgi:predicted DNA-binding ArsR family transcriptional regulator